MRRIDKVQQLISDYYSRGGGTYAGAAELFEAENSAGRQGWHDLVKERDRLKFAQEHSSPLPVELAAKLAKKTEWSEAKQKIAEFQALNNLERVVGYSSSRSKNPYVVVDKSSATAHLYMPGSNKPIYSGKVNIGMNRGDFQTVTKYVDMNNDGRITEADKVNGRYKTDWSAGNMMTGAGRYVVSNIDKRGYDGQPIINMMNEAQYDNFLKTGNVENVATSIHSGYTPGKDRITNGCLRAGTATLEQFAKHLVNGSEVFILPEDEGNEFTYSGGGLHFKPSQKYFTDSRYVKDGKNYYVDQVGRIQVGQGINRSVNTLKYEPLEIGFDEDRFRKDHFSLLDFDDTRVMNKTTVPFIRALENRKKDIMSAAKIGSEAYNDIAKTAFGIYGAETSFGDTNSPPENVLKLIGKLIGKITGKDTFGGPDYKWERGPLGGENNSVGLTQVRWSFLNADEKEALKSVGITSNRDFRDPEKAAIGTAIILGIRYNQQLTAAEKKDIPGNLPRVWNNRPGYADRVKRNSEYLKLSTPTFDL